MKTVPLPLLVKYCDSLLHPGEVTDYDGAWNGLQVENRGRVKRIAAAVDASLATVKLADLMIVHHGLFWNARHPWTGGHYELLRHLLEQDVAIYSSHLPLDLHPRLGNNARLCAALGWRGLKPFFHEKGQFIGWRAHTRISRTELQQRLGVVLGREPILLPGGPSVCRRIGVVTGGAGSHLRTAAAEGVDTFITGEGPHWSYAQAEELGLNAFYGGHYATETFGVKALAAELSRKFGVPWTFVDHPTGL
jgi:dinuclear metal center YbgI/SA1388 family protein